MAPNNPAPIPGAIVLDANVLIALASREIGRASVAAAELTHYSSMGYQWFAPGVVIAETLYVLCGKLQAGDLCTVDHATAVQTFIRTMASIAPPPNGDSSLIARAEQIRNGYGCSRSADGIYLALAEELSQTRPTVILTFDKGMPNQAANNAPLVSVKLL